MNETLILLIDGILLNGVHYSRGVLLDSSRSINFFPEPWKGVVAVDGGGEFKAKVSYENEMIAPVVSFDANKKTSAQIDKSVFLNDLIVFEGGTNIIHIEVCSKINTLNFPVFLTNNRCFQPCCFDVELKLFPATFNELPDFDAFSNYILCRNRISRGMHAARRSEFASEILIIASEKRLGPGMYLPTSSFNKKNKYAVFLKRFLHDNIYEATIFGETNVPSDLKVGHVLKREVIWQEGLAVHKIDKNIAEILKIFI